MKPFFIRAVFILLSLAGLTTLFLPPNLSQAAILIVTGTVNKVSDGDTIHLITPEQTKLRVRLFRLYGEESGLYRIMREQKNFGNG
jgi:endonuclease YncB( thermonuclease family)